MVVRLGAARAMIHAATSARFKNREKRYSTPRDGQGQGLSVNVSPLDGAGFGRSADRPMMIPFDVRPMNSAPAMPASVNSTECRGSAAAI
jgi:hypothetical protein